MSRHAIVARELDLSAIVGMKHATTTIPDGAIIELDPGESARSPSSPDPGPPVASLFCGNATTVPIRAKEVDVGSPI